MGKLIVGLAIVSSLIAATVYLSKPGYCWMCPDWDCYGSGSCGHGCFCVKGPGEMTGKCYSVEHR